MLVVLYCKCVVSLTPVSITPVYWRPFGLFVNMKSIQLPGFELRHVLNLIRLKKLLSVTSNSLAKRSSFRESSFVLAQANYRKLQRIVKRKWNKRIFLFSNLQFLIHFFRHMKMKCWYLDSQLTTQDLNRNYRSSRSHMLFLIGVLKNFVRACNFIQKKLQHRCFPAKLEKLRALFLHNSFGGCFWNYRSYFTLKYTCVSKRRDVKNWLIRLLINPALFSFKMKNMAVLLK